MIRPARYTSSHFADKPLSRCGSAPPKVYVDLASDEATRRELIAQRRRERRFARFSKQWRALAQMAVALEEKQYADSVIEEADKDAGTRLDQAVKTKHHLYIS